MQIKVFQVPCWGDPQAEEELNQFLRSERVLRVEKNFVEAGTNSFWCVWVEFLEGSNASNKRKRGRDKVDYKAELPPAIFARFARLREWRKEQARTEAVPPYAVFTNQELAQIASLEEVNEASLRQIEGIGEKRAAKYTATLKGMLNDEASGEPSINDHGAK